MSVIETDALTYLLQTVQLKSAILGRAKMTAPWGLHIEKPDGAMFYIVKQGRCWLEMEDLDQLVELSVGDLIVLPHGNPHTLSDDLKSPRVSLQDLSFTYPNQGLKMLVHGGGGVESHIIAGYFQFRQQLENPLVRALPALMHIKGSEHEQSLPALDMTLQFIISEADNSMPGSQAVISRLGDVLFIQAVRAFLMEEAGEKRGWLSALADPDIGTVLGLMLRAPEKPWTVESLAEEAAMSRSAFATRFREMVGQPPIECLTEWRMYKATELLSKMNSSLREIAEQIGYGSEAAFSKAFKRRIGIPPGTYRKRSAQRDGNVVS